MLLINFNHVWPWVAFLCWCAVKETIDVKNVLNVFYFVQRFLNFFKTCIGNPIKSFVKHFLDHRNKLISNSDVVYLVSPNILNKMFFFYLVSLMLLSYDHTAELKLNEVLSI